MMLPKSCCNQNSIKWSTHSTVKARVEGIQTVPLSPSEYTGISCAGVCTSATSGCQRRIKCEVRSCSPSFHCVYQADMFEWHVTEIGVVTSMYESAVSIFPEGVKNGCTPSHQVTETRTVSFIICCCWDRHKTPTGKSVGRASHSEVKIPPFIRRVYFWTPVYWKLQRNWKKFK